MRSETLTSNAPAKRLSVLSEGSDFPFSTLERNVCDMLASFASAPCDSPFCIRMALSIIRDRVLRGFLKGDTACRFILVACGLQGCE